MNHPCVEKQTHPRLNNHLKDLTVKSLPDFAWFVLFLEIFPKKNTHTHTLEERLAVDLQHKTMSK